MKKIKAAGAIVHREIGNELEILLVHRPKYQDWSFPKGKLDPGETAEAAAVREVEEETGVPVVLDTPIGSVEYHTEGVKNLQVTTRKSVQYYIAHEINPEFDEVKPRDPVKPASRKEIDDVRWVTLNEAEQLLTYRDDQKVLKRFVAEIYDKDLTNYSLIIEMKKIDFSNLNEFEQKQAIWKITSTMSAFGINCIIVFNSKSKRKSEERLRTVKRYCKSTGLKVLKFENAKSEEYQNIIKSDLRIAIVK